MNVKDSLSLFITLCLFCCNLASAGIPEYNTASSITTGSTSIPQMLPDDGLPIFIEGASIGPNQEFCLNITTSGFDSIVSMQYTMNWDPTVLKFISATLIDMPDQSNFGFGTTNACTLGILAVSWNADQVQGFASVPDGTILYELCFMVIGSVGESTDVAFTGNPLGIEVIHANSNGTDIGLDNTDGTVLIIEPIGLTGEEVVDVNCSNIDQGEINLSFQGGTPPYNYQWEGPIIINDNSPTLTGLPNGTYYLTLTDSSPFPAVFMDTIEVEGYFDVSLANAGLDTSLNCYNNGVVELIGSVDPDNGDNNFEWYSDNGAMITGMFTLSPEVTEPGIYYLISYNVFSNCADTSSVFVADNTNPPFVDAGEDDELNCFQSTLLLNGNNSDQDNKIFSWATIIGNIVSGDSTLTPLIDAPGDYTLTVLDTITGCTASNSVTINQDNALPNAVVEPEALLTCVVSPVELNGIGSTTGSDFSYLWIGPGMILDETSLTPTVSEPGIYQLIVTDDLNMCSDTATVTVSQDELPPSPIDAGPAVPLTCEIFANILDGTASVQGPDYIYFWTTTDGNIFEGENTLEPVVDACGTYTLEITSLITGCSGFSSVTVACDTMAPVIDIGGDELITCAEPIATLDGSNSSSGPEFSYTWNTVFGNITSADTIPIVTVDDAGVYGLLIEDESNGCIALSTVFVGFDTLPPLANAGGATTIECGDPISLDGNGSTQGDTVSYLWTTINGSILEDDNTTMPLIDASGEYIIWVTNDLNGCLDSDTALVDGAPPLEDAELEADSVLCGDETVLTGNLPFSASGVWTSSNSNDFIENPLMENTNAVDLEPGWHTFFWTLSTLECPDYDMDSLQIYVEGTPLAIEDQFDLSGYITSHEINVLENDDLSQVQNWNLGLVSEADTGQLINLGEGLFEFSYPEGYFGTQSFEYFICNEICPDQCDTTIVLLNISEPIDTITDIANGITPNGDGVNEEFIIPEIKNNPELYPNNELIIYSRWGDIVYKAKPYNNDWTGTNNSGKELPQGTYYYLLRLDVGEGVIYQGDITILR